MRLATFALVGLFFVTFALAQEARPLTPKADVGDRGASRGRVETRPDRGARATRAGGSHPTVVVTGP